MIDVTKNLFLIKSNSVMSVRKLILSNIKNSINNGMKTFFKHKRKMLKHCQNLKTDILLRFKRIERSLKKNYL